jgi:hypothetical protein
MKKLVIRRLRADNDFILSFWWLGIESRPLAF